MKMKLLFIAVSGCFLCAAQVGINTITPEATLDINGDLIVRNVADAASAPSYDYLVRNSTTNVVEKVSGNLGTTTTNNTIAKASKSSTTGLLGTSFYSGYNRIDFSTGDIDIDKGSNFNSADDTYTVPTTGVYAVDFDYQYGNGVELQLLSFSGNPRVAILKQDGATYSVVDSRIFSGANISLPLGIGAFSVVISKSQINSLYELNAGDVLSFEVLLGGIALNVLGQASTSVSIYKISD